MRSVLFFLMTLVSGYSMGYSLKRVSVHDPSIVWDSVSKTYYIFGSHRATAKTTDLMRWTTLTAPWATANSTNAANNVAFTSPQVTKIKKNGAELNFSFNAMAWSKRGNVNYNVDGNMWAPDVVYNKAMKKWCMYLSVNGDNWYSSIILLTSDKITGPYRYQAPVVISGFHTGTSYKDTDLEIVIGTQSSLPSRYVVGNNWGRRYPNCIDPCVFYDEAGKLWLSYGSWSGGIYMLELDEQTGLRDYDVEYKLTGSGDGITVDPYFGKKIAGGYYASGEGSYIEYIGGYYYLFVTNGGLAAGGVANDYNNGGYQMRVFRSQNPTLGLRRMMAIAVSTSSVPTHRGAIKSRAIWVSGRKVTAPSSLLTTVVPIWSIIPVSKTGAKAIRCASTKCFRTRVAGWWQRLSNIQANK